MIAITIPTTDVNSESAVVVRWYFDDRSEVQDGEPLVEIETSKSILDVAAPGRGVLLRLFREGDQLKMDQPLGFLFETREALERFETARIEAPVAAADENHRGRITAPARRRASQLGVDIEAVALSTSELITAKLVDAFAARVGKAPSAELPDPLPARPGVQRLLVIGAGLGATQVLDILSHDHAKQAVALIDEDAARHGEIVDGVPVIGGIDRALELFASGAFDAAVIAISTSVPARTRLRERCEQVGLPLANVIDPTARIASGVRMGSGNIVCANCHFGVGVTVGDNNFISAYNSFDHHSVLGSDISTGPGCITSGVVRIEDRCRLGTGIFIEPHVTLGAGCQVASGAIIVGSVPADHAVKTKVATTAVVPIRW